MSSVIYKSEDITIRGNSNSPLGMKTIELNGYGFSMELNTLEIAEIASTYDCQKIVDYMILAYYERQFELQTD